ncbi:MAG: peptide-methionine (S)-S-oxide reductase MsrA [Spirochaetota bacterium]
MMLGTGFLSAKESKKNRAVATFAGGCFWCMEAPFDKVPGVYSTTSGYTGGLTQNPNYADVSSGITGHAEAIQIVYNPQKVSYKKLLQVFWRNIDPTVSNRQFCDTGNQYRTAIFYQDQKQKELALQSSKVVKKRFGKIYTQIAKAAKFYPAEDYHQNYYQTNPIRYKYYRYRCGRDQRLEKLWGKK